MKRLPLGIQNFKEILTDGHVYVDKTRYIYNLINGVKYYFLSRPRRFGKSLLLDTISEAFGGDRELFKGLYLYDSDYAFEKHPVLRLDMSNMVNETPEMLKTEINNELRLRIKSEGFDFDYETPSSLLKNLIRELHAKYGKTVVVLIDEYDKPILDRLGNLDIAEGIRDVLRSFYGVIKSMDPHIKLAFITGITKFAKTSIFSGLNNLSDITFVKDYACICGVATEDLDRYFGEHIAVLASDESNKHYSNINDEILAWYDGYSWDGKTRVINPFSLLSLLSWKSFKPYWFATGTPKFMMDLVQKDPSEYINIDDLIIDESMLDTAELDSLDAAILMFQTGYLTVKEVTRPLYEYIFHLDMPNREVRIAFNSNLLAAFTGKKQRSVKNVQLSMEEAFLKNDMQKFLDALRGLYAAIPYHIHVDQEAYYHSIFYAVMNTLGYDVRAEVPVAEGRVDATVDIGDRVYVIEFKYKKCANDATPEKKSKLMVEALDDGMEQIKARGYSKKYIGSGKLVFHIALAIVGRDDIEMRIEEAKLGDNDID